MNREVVASHTISNILANLSRIVFGGIALVYVARKLGPSQYGIVSLGLAIAAIAKLFCDFGISTSTACFLAKEKSPSTEIYQNGQFLNLIFSLVFSLIIFFFAKPLSLVLNINSVGFIQITSVFTFFTSLFYFSVSSLQGIKQAGRIALLNFLHNAFTSIIVVVLAYIGYKAGGVLFGYATATCIIWIIAMVFLQKYFPLFRLNLGVYKMKRIFYYALPLLLTSSSYFLLLRSPSILLSTFTGTDNVAYFSIPLRIIEVISLPAFSLSIVITPFFTKANHHTHNLTTLWIKTLKFCTIFYIPLSIFLFILADNIISTVFGTMYINASIVMAIFALYLPFFACATVASKMLDFLDIAKQKSIVFASATAATIFLSFCLIPSFKETGAAIAIVFPYVIFSCYAIVKSSKECNVSLKQYLRKFILLLLTSFVSVIPAYFISTFVKGIFGLILSFIFFGSVFILGGIILHFLTIQEIMSILQFSKIRK